VDNRRHTNPARLGKRLQPRRDIDPVAVDVVVLDNDVTEIDADTKYDSLVFRNRDVALGHTMLHCNRAGHGFNDARKLYEDSVPGRFDDAPFVVGDLGIDQFTAMGSEPSAGAGLVLAHQPAVSRDIGREDGCEPAFDPLSAQGSPPRGALRKTGLPGDSISKTLHPARKPINGAADSLGPPPVVAASARASRTTCQKQRLYGHIRTAASWPPDTPLARLRMSLEGRALPPACGATNGGVGAQTWRSGRPGRAAEPGGLRPFPICPACDAHAFKAAVYRLKPRHPGLFSSLM